MATVDMRRANFRLPPVLCPAAAAKSRNQAVPLQQKAESKHNHGSKSKFSVAGSQICLKISFARCLSSSDSESGVGLFLFYPSSVFGEILTKCDNMSRDGYMLIQLVVPENLRRTT
jgi:hypothetical protein